MTLDPEDIKRGTELLIKHLEGLREENPELGDFHAAFEHYCMNKYALGSSATTHRTAVKHDLGIDFYSTRDRAYHVAQCKIPERNWLEAHPERIKPFGPSVVNDPRDALGYLLGDSKITANEHVKRLYSLVASDRRQDDFSFVFFLIVFGHLNERAEAAFQELKAQYEEKGARLVLQQIEDLVDEFTVGSARATDQIQLDLRIDSKGVLHARDYCYFLANAADLFHAFRNYGWRLFDLNLRYEIRNSPVNGDIIESLKHQKSRRRFHHYNNGLIIVTANYALREQNSRIRLTGAQIVNGLQTVKSIYNAVTGKDVSLDDLDKDCVVQVKAIQTGEPSFISEIVQATNNQNPMAARNLKANNREQKALRTEFASLRPRWFFQVKEGEWESLTQEGGRFFKQVVGFPPMEFKPDPGRKKGRVIDNQEAAKAWLAFIGFPDLAGDRVTHYFAEDSVCEIAFTMRPKEEHWKRMGDSVDFDDPVRRETIESQQGSAEQYLLAYSLWQFIKYFVPSPQRYRDEGLNEGVKAGKIQKASGSIVSPIAEQDAYLTGNHTYQTWRLMANMKEILVQAAALVFIRKYGPLKPEVCWKILRTFDAKDFLTSGDLQDVAKGVANASDLPADAVFSRICGFLRHVSGQFWEDKEKQLLATSRLRTVLLRPDLVADFKRKVWEVNERRGLDKPWKPEGKTFLESLPDASAQG